MLPPETTSHEPVGSSKTSSGDRLATQDIEKVEAGESHAQEVVEAAAGIVEDKSNCDKEEVHSKEEAKEEVDEQEEQEEQEEEDYGDEEEEEEAEEGEEEDEDGKGWEDLQGAELAAAKYVRLSLHSDR